MSKEKEEVVETDLHAVEMPAAETVTDVDAFLADLAADDPVAVHPVQTRVNGKLVEFLVKELDQNEAMEISIGPLTFIDGKYVKNAKLEGRLSINLRIHYGIVKNIGTEANPKYAPLFSLAQIDKLYTGKQRGKLLDFLYDSVVLFNSPKKK